MKQHFVWSLDTDIEWEGIHQKQIFRIKLAAARKKVAKPKGDYFFWQNNVFPGLFNYDSSPPPPLIKQVQICYCIEEYKTQNVLLILQYDVR